MNSDIITIFAKFPRFPYFMARKQEIEPLQILEGSNNIHCNAQAISYIENKSANIATSLIIAVYYDKVYPYLVQLCKHTHAGIIF